MRTRFLLSVALGDLLLLAGSVAASSWLLFGTPFPWMEPSVGLRVLPLLWVLVAAGVVASAVTAGMMGPGVPRPAYGRALAIVGTSLVLTVFTVIGTRMYFSRSLLAVTFVLWGLGALAHRAVRRQRPWTERVAVISHEKELIDDLDAAPHVRVVEVIDPQHQGPIEPLPRGTVVAVDLKAVLSERVAQFVSSSNIAGYAVEPLTRVYEEHTGRIPLVHLAEGWEISAPLLRAVPYLGGKRVFDLTITVITAPIWLVLGGLVAATVWISSRRPVIFRQTRVGKDGEPFVMYKFRTMRQDAEASGPAFAQSRDHRLIRGGALLRKFHVDELPQLFNVLRGEMSLVGPRAEQLAFVERFRDEIPFYEHRHLVRPGVTGWAQVNYGYADDTAETIEKLTYDLYYVKHMSPVLDLRILWLSIWTVVTGQGAR